MTGQWAVEAGFRSGRPHRGNQRRLCRGCQGVRSTRGVMTLRLPSCRSGALWDGGEYEISPLALRLKATKNFDRVYLRVRNSKKNYTDKRYVLENA